MGGGTGGPDPRIRKVLPCWMVRGRSAICAQAAHTNIVSIQRTLTGYLGAIDRRLAGSAPGGLSGVRSFFARSGKKRNNAGRIKRGAGCILIIAWATSRGMVT